MAGGVGGVGESGAEVALLAKFVAGRFGVKARAGAGARGKSSCGDWLWAGAEVGMGVADSEWGEDVRSPI